MVEIKEFLTENKGQRYTIQELTELLKLAHGTVSLQLRKLHKNNEIKMNDKKFFMKDNSKSRIKFYEYYVED
jgi:predicted transcriptional regulator